MMVAATSLVGVEKRAHYSFVPRSVVPVGHGTSLVSQWRGSAKRSAMQSIPDRYFAEAAACDSVGFIATT
jgi:hypothetical protein